MDQIILANQQSELEKAELKNGSKDLQYSAAMPYPIFGKANKIYAPRISFPSGDPSGNQMTFDVATAFYNHLSRFRFNYKLVCTGAVEEVDAYARLPIAMLLLDYIRFMDNGVQLMELKGSAYRGLVMNLPQHKRDYILRYARPLDASDNVPTLIVGNNEVHSFLPLLSSWFTGSFEKAINTSIVQTMQIEIKFKTLAEAGLKTGAITAFTGSIDMRYWKPEDKIYRELLDKNYVNPLAMETWDSIVEEVPCDAGAGGGSLVTQRWPSKVPYFTFKTIAYVAKKNMEVTTVVGCPFQAIESVSLTMGGTQYLDNYTRSMCEFEGLMNGMRSCGIASSIVASTETTITGQMYLANSTHEIFPIDYSAICSENSNTGGAFFSKLNNPEFTVRWRFNQFDGENSSAYSLYLVHYHWRNTTISNGYAQSFA